MNKNIKWYVLLGLAIFSGLLYLNRFGFNLPYQDNIFQEFPSRQLLEHLMWGFFTAITLPLLVYPFVYKKIMDSNKNKKFFISLIFILAVVGWSYFFFNSNLHKTGFDIVGFLAAIGYLICMHIRLYKTKPLKSEQNYIKYGN